MLPGLIEDYIIDISMEQKNKILAAAQQAPTGDNAQHWNLSFSSNVLIIRHDQEAAKHILNDAFNASLLSLGAVVESVKICSSEFSFGTHIEYSFDNKNSEVWASVYFTNSDDVIEDDLLNGIYLRETNRAHYKKLRIPLGFLDEAMSFGAKMGVNVSEKSRLSKKCKSYLIKCEQYIWNNPVVFTDTVKWIRHSREEVEKTRNGFGLENLFLNKIDGFMIKVFSKSRTLLKIFWNLGMKLKVHLDARASINNTGSFITFSTKGSSDIDIVNCGRVMLRTWVLLNMNSHGVQPLTIASLLPFNLRKFGKLRACPNDYMEEFKASRLYFEDSFNLSHEEQVIWMLRTGPVKPLTKNQRTLRYEVSKNS